MKHPILIFNIFIFILLLSCNNNQPIPESDFIKIYADMTIMQDTLRIPQKEISEKVLSKYNFTNQDYERTINYYDQHPDQWPKFFDKVIEYLEELRAKSKISEPLFLPNRYVLMDK